MAKLEKYILNYSAFSYSMSSNVEKHVMAGLSQYDLKKLTVTTDPIQSFPQIPGLIINPLPPPPEEVELGQS